MALVGVGAVIPNPMTYVAHLLAVTAIVMVLVWYINFRDGGFGWQYGELHPVIMLIGLVIIGGEAILSYKALPLKKEIKKLIHLVLHASALTLGITGIYAAFKYNNDNGIPNLFSLHSWLGIGVIVLFGFQWIFGFGIFFYPGGTSSLRGNSLPWHVLFGLTVFILAVANASLGFLEILTFYQSEGLPKYGSESLLLNFTAIVTILFGAFVVISSISKAPEPEDEYAPL